MSYSILHDLKECLIAQEKKRNSINRFEWMEIFLQNVVQMDTMEKFLRMPILRIKQALQEKFPKGSNPLKILCNSFESKEP